eukprot:g44087.t1
MADMVIHKGALVKPQHFHSSRQVHILAGDVDRSNEPYAMELNDDDFDEPMETESAVKVEMEPEKNIKVKEPDDEDKPLIISNFIESSCWDRMDRNENDSVVIDVQVDAGRLPLVTGLEGEQVFRFYWVDAYEDQYHQP